MAQRPPTDLKVLVVEDYDVNLEIVLDMLDVLGIRAEGATNGKEALQKMKTEKYDLIFMDIRMPIMDGYTCTDEIRKLPIDQPLIIALTASSALQERVQFEEHGFDDYLLKPTELGEFEKILTKWGAFDNLHIRPEKRCYNPRAS